MTKIVAWWLLAEASIDATLEVMRTRDGSWEGVGGASFTFIQVPRITKITPEKDPSLVQTTQVPNCVILIVPTKLYLSSS